MKFVMKLLKLAAPIALTNFLIALLNIVDSLMASTLDEVSMASVVLVNSFVFLYQIIAIVTGSTLTVFVSQFFGKGDKENIKRSVKLSFIIVMIIAFLFTVASLFFARSMLSLFGATDAVLDSATPFLQIVGLTSIPYAITMIIISGMRGIMKVRVPVATSAICVVLNAFFNYSLMFGKFGLPALGLQGAAYGTLLSRFIEMSILLIYSYLKASPIQITLRIPLPRLFIRKYFKLFWPAFINEFFWSLAFTVYLVAFGRMENSTTILASYNVIRAIDQLIVVGILGVGLATGIVCGNYLGKNEIAKAKEFSKRSVGFAFITGFIWGALFIIAGLFSGVVFTNLPFEVTDIILKSCIVYGVMLPIRSVNFLLAVGVLRSGGDAMRAALIELSSIWLIGVPLAFISALILNFSLPIIFLCINIEEFVKVFFLLKRLRSGKWANNITNVSSELISLPIEN